jgi:hypothetical protein
MANDDQIHRNTTEARAGATPGMTRYILAASLVLVIVAFIIVYNVA